MYSPYAFSFDTLSVPGPTALVYDAIDPKNKRKPRASLLRSEDAEADEGGRRKLVGGSRDVVRNFTIARWMVRRHLDYVSDFNFKAKTDNKELNKAWEAEIAAVSTKTAYDVANRHSRPKAMRIAEACRTIDGDVLNVRMADGRTQWIEGDRLRDSHDLPAGVDRASMVKGVLVDKASAAMAYAVHKRGRGTSAADTGGSFTFERMVPAANAYLHGYFENRFDQVRGLSPLVTALNELTDTYEGFDYARAKMKVSQLFALAIFREAGGEEQDFNSHQSEDGTGYDVDFGRGPTLLDLDPGDRAEFLESKTPSTETQAFASMVIAVALKSLDIPYSFYAENFTNYSGSRGARLDYEKSCKTKRDDNRDYLNWWLGWRTQLMLLDGKFPGADPKAFRGLWIATGIPWIDPLKEVLGSKEELACALNSRTRILMERGDDFDDIVDELEYEQKRLADAGLPTNLNSDNAVIAALIQDDAPVQAKN